MKKGLIAVACVVALAVPALIASIWMFGCCALPFHDTLHHVIPLCRVATLIVHEQHEQHGRQTAPRPAERHGIPHRFAAEPAARSPFAAPSSTTADRTAIALTGRRSFISLGASRCDDDIGARLAFLDTLLV